MPRRQVYLNRVFFEPKGFFVGGENAETGEETKAGFEIVDEGTGDRILGVDEGVLRIIEIPEANGPGLEAELIPFDPVLSQDDGILLDSVTLAELF